jgi:hypothetical protein
LRDRGGEQPRLACSELAVNDSPKSLTIVL